MDGNDRSSRFPRGSREGMTLLPNVSILGRSYDGSRENVMRNFPASVAIMGLPAQ